MPSEKSTGRSAVSISSPDKILFPEAKIDKRKLARYFAELAPHMLPYLRDYPLTFKQYPHGIEERGFFHKHAPDYFADYIPRIDVPMRSREGRIMHMLTAKTGRQLVYFANQNVIEIHVALSRAGNLDKPTQMIFDLDPSDDSFDKVRQVAFLLRAALDDRDLPVFVKTTGSRGVHLHIPLRGRQTFDAVKREAKEIASEVAEQNPELATIEQRKNQRGKRVFIDYLRNDYAMTAIAPFSPRALAGAPLATPIDWRELRRSSMAPGRYQLKNILRRLGQKRDPWRDFRSAAS